MLNFLTSYDQPIDCADLAILGLVRFADVNRLPVRLFDYEERPKRWFNFVPGSTDAGRYAAKVMEQLGAVNVIENSVAVPVSELRAGDLIMTELRGENSTGHTRVVTTVTYDAQRQDWLIDWMQGTLPPVVPERRQHYFREIPTTVQPLPRRWNFGQFG